MAINRYSQKNGELVKSDDGDWVKYEDLKNLIEAPENVNTTHPYIWGEGWYALKHHYDTKIWWLAPIKFFDEHGYCPDGWEWDRPEGMSADDLENFIDDYGFEPKIPKQFVYCMESAIKCTEDLNQEEQKEILKKFGYTVDNVPKWRFEK